MIIGVAKEIKNHEYRVGLVPSGAFELSRHGHKVLVETNAGNAIGFSDKDYTDAGAEIVNRIKRQLSASPEFNKIKNTCIFANGLGLVVNAGHGLNYHNVQAIAKLPQIHELNIGFAIIVRSVFDGLPLAVKTMKQLMLDARQL